MFFCFCFSRKRTYCVCVCVWHCVSSLHADENSSYFSFFSVRTRANQNKTKKHIPGSHLTDRKCLIFIYFFTYLVRWLNSHHLKDTPTSSVFIFGKCHRSAADGRTRSSNGVGLCCQQSWSLFFLRFFFFQMGRKSSAFLLFVCPFFFYLKRSSSTLSLFFFWGGYRPFCSARTRGS